MVQIAGTNNHSAFSFSQRAKLKMQCECLRSQNTGMFPYITILFFVCLNSYSQAMNPATDSICFTIPAGTEYCGALLEYQHSGNQIRAVIEVGPETWESIDLIELFKLRLDVRNPGRISGTKSVQLVIVLDPKIYEELNASKALPADQRAFLATDAKHPARSALNWFATEVTEEVDLPESLKSMGSLREGFTTKWKDTLR